MTMEIAPIPGVRALPVMKTSRTEFGLPEVFELEGAARPGDGETQREGKKAAGAEEDDPDDLMQDAETDGEAPQVDYFA